MTDWAKSTFLRIACDLDVFRDGRMVPLDVLDAYTVAVELAFRELLNGGLQS